MKVFGERLKQLRLKRNMTQDELAAKLNISKRTLLRYESGISEPTIGILISLSLIFNVSIDYIAGVKDTTIINEESIKDELNNIVENIQKIQSKL